MKNNDEILKIKKELKSLREELNESSAQLGGVFYDSGIVLENSTIDSEINALEVAIPEIKSKMESLKSYNISIEEAEKEIKESSTKIKDLDSKINTVLEKVGVELYCFVGEKELSYSIIKGFYTELKEGESKSEILEHKLYALENGDNKKNFIDTLSTPFVIRGIKKDLNNNNKESLKKFQELGRAYTHIPQLVENETNESILDILNEYNDLTKSQKSLIDKQYKLKIRIEENEEKIKLDSQGVKLKTLYSKLEQNIVDHQNLITEKLVDLGFEVAKAESLSIENKDVLKKLELFRDIEGKIRIKEKELIYYENSVKKNQILKEITDREESIKIEEDHIAQRQQTLNDHLEALERLMVERDKMLEWLENEENTI